MGRPADPLKMLPREALAADVARFTAGGDWERHPLSPAQRRVIKRQHNRKSRRRLARVEFDTDTNAEGGSA